MGQKLSTERNISFDINEIRDENTGEYEGYEVFYSFQTETRPDLCISETVVLDIEKMGFYMVFELKTE